MYCVLCIVLCVMCNVLCGMCYVLCVMCYVLRVMCYVYVYVYVDAYAYASVGSRPERRGSLDFAFWYVRSSCAFLSTLHPPCCLCIFHCFVLLPIASKAKGVLPTQTPGAPGRGPLGTPGPRVGAPGGPKPAFGGLFDLVYL